MRISNRFEKHIVAAATVAMTAAAANAGLVTWNANLVIPNNIDGQYINVETQVAGSAAGNVAGWDLNPYGTSTTAMSWFAAAAPSGCVMGLGQGGVTAAVASLSGGTLVGVASTFGNTASSVTAGGWVLNSANYFGFRFVGADTGTHYGWGIMTVGATWALVLLLRSPLRPLQELASSSLQPQAHSLCSALLASPLVAVAAK